MSEAENRRFWCLIENQQQPFSLQVKVDGDIEDLKREAQKERKDLLNYDTSDIVLLKLNDPIQINPIETLTQRIRDANPPVVELRDPSSKVLDEFPELPADRKVHIIVKHPPESPSGGFAIPKSASQPQPLGGHIILRTELVNLLDQRLSEYQIIHVTQSALTAG